MPLWPRSERWRHHEAKCQKASDHDAENRELTDPIKHAR